jgi:hypothetical protein
MAAPTIVGGAVIMSECPVIVQCAPERQHRIMQISHSPNSGGTAMADALEIDETQVSDV